MENRFDLSWDSFPNDGASAPVAVPTAVDPDEYDELFRAWCQERRESIELKLCLDEAVRLLKHLFAKGEVTSECRRRAKQLLLAIKNTEHGP
ncbi:hypothetical protein SAMN05444166_3090 [Singulisphaera sp. GP187]|uniref:hypothetical protein n=1 Tax=Singulisphaera sp. GP187 TaxID=1882752 RepID=UPI0009279878|nr:hypothetical protein [Singulisphaera sp. GP187]SIO22494.1 hypothetical protein SAMN05444166_3090 [Singulisphaera sp. GP187]